MVTFRIYAELHVFVEIPLGFADWTRLLIDLTGRQSRARSHDGPGLQGERTVVCLMESRAVDVKLESRVGAREA